MRYDYPSPDNSLSLTYFRDRRQVLREVASILEDEHCITSDSAVVNIRPAVVYQITDPQKLVLNVQNHLEALRTAITATLRAVVGSMTLTDAITGREAIATQMRARLAEQADRWGESA